MTFGDRPKIRAERLVKSRTLDRVEFEGYPFSWDTNAHVMEKWCKANCADKFEVRANFFVEFWSSDDATLCMMRWS